MNVNLYCPDENVEIAEKKDTTRWMTMPTVMNVERSRKNLELLVKKDTIAEPLNVKSHLSTKFWLGNLFSGVGIIGYAIDLTNPKRFTYPKDIVAHYGKNYYQTIPKYMTWRQPEKGLLNFKISVPESNWFFINSGNGNVNRFGFLGVLGGVEYYLTDKNSINADFGVMTDFPLPVPAPIDYLGSYKRAFATYGDVQVGQDFKRFHVDAGLQFNQTLFVERETLEVFPEYIDILKSYHRQLNFGLALSSYFKITKTFNLGINYYPTFVSFYDKKSHLGYNHLMFLELIFKIEAYRPKNK